MVLQCFLYDFAMFSGCIAGDAFTSRKFTWHFVCPQAVLTINETTHILFLNTNTSCSVHPVYRDMCRPVAGVVSQEVATRGHYDDCERCSRAFESVAQSALTFTQQVIAGDAWGEVM